MRDLGETYDLTIAGAEEARPGVEDKIEHKAKSNFMTQWHFKVLICAREILRCTFSDLGWPRNAENL